MFAYWPGNCIMQHLFQNGVVVVSFHLGLQATFALYDVIIHRFLGTAYVQVTFRFQMCINCCIVLKWPSDAHFSVFKIKLLRSKLYLYLKLLFC
jgi:hypothetical protein